MLLLLLVLETPVSRLKFNIFDFLTWPKLLTGALGFGASFSLDKFIG